LGEISRHLKGTTLSHREDDTHDFSKDYPILPTRRRFWENALRVLDQTGTDSQLRNQLNMVHKAIQTNLDSPLGHVIPADYLYFDLADKLVQTSVLPRKFHETTMKWITSPEGENKLIARACGIVFLISKLSGQNSEIGIKANIDTLADLLVEDLSQGSSNLRATLPNLLEKCELLLKVDDEFRIQTQESAAWNDEFNTQINTLSNNIHGVHLERDIQIRKKFEAIIGKLSKVHGKSKVTRKINIGYDTDSSPNENNVVNIWVRDGWSSDEDTVRSDSRQAGLNSPTIFLFIPRHSADNLLLYLTTYKAAVSTLERRGDPNSPEGQEARDAMLTRKTTAEQKFSELLDTILENTCVFQGGGNEIVGSTLKDKLQEAFNNSLKRLYLKFDLADSDAWNKVYEQAKKGFADSLQKINHQGNPEDNDVCKAILGYIGGGKDGLSLRNNFELPPYGWPRDAIDGALQALLVSKLVLAHDDRSQVISPKDLDRRDIGKTRFKLETVTISAKQFMRIRGLFLEVGVNTNPNEELKHVPLFLEKMQNLLDSSGGDAPKPDKPPKNLIDKIKQPAGNEQLLCIYEHSDELSKTYKEWTKLSEKINIRLESWNELQRLVNHASGLKDMTDIKNQVLTIKSERQLIFDPDPIQPLIDTLTQKLRDELNRLNALFSTKFAEGQKLLEANPYFNKLDSHQKNQLLSAQRLLDSMRPKVDVETTGEVLKTLDNLSLTTFADRVEALKERFNNVALEAARILEPQAHSIQVPRRTLKSTEEVDTWLKEVEKLLKTALDKGPIIIQ
jgi:hypothetical protein